MRSRSGCFQVLLVNVSARDSLVIDGRSLEEFAHPRRRVVRARLHVLHGKVKGLLGFLNAHLKDLNEFTVR